MTTAARGSWDARYADGDLALSGLAVEVFVHHSVTAQLAASASVATERTEMQKLESVGQSRFGTGISYNVVIFPSGRAYQGVSWNRRGTHTGGRNSTSRSICFAGNYETHTPTAASLMTAAGIYAEGKGKWWRVAAPLRGHRDVSQTACPGKHLYARLSVIRGGFEHIDNPIEPPGVPSPSPALIVVDGFWGSATTTRLQRLLGTPVDGWVSSQPGFWRSRNPGLTTGWDWTRGLPNGSRVMSALQDIVGAKRDGLIGPDTISDLQRRVGVKTVDGVISRESRTVMEVQRRLNDGRI